MRTYKADEWIRREENITLQKNTLHHAEQPHTHEFAEFVYILSGKGCHFIGGVPYEVQKGSFLYINYNELHAFESSETMVYINILLRPEFMGKELINSENILEIFSVIADEAPDPARPIVLFEGRDLLEIEYILERMLYEFQHKETGYKSALGGYMRVIFSKLIRQMKEVRQDTPQLQNVSPDVIRYIQEHCFEKISLTEIAERCFYNPSYLSRTFKKLYGKSPIAYIQECRIQKAAALLESTDLTVDHICLQVGYSDKKQFYRLFREFAGCTPNEYRKRNKMPTARS